jgi:myo-inositol-1(or 4)-monophosphatase
VILGQTEAMTVNSWTDEELLELFDDVCRSVRTALNGLTDWSLLGSEGAHAGQYRHDVVADEVALGILDAAGVGVLSEESGLRRADASVVVVIDPIDGSTNASHQLPWYATSLCAVDADGPRVAMVVNQASGVRYTAVRGGGAFRDGQPIHASTTESFRKSIVAVSGLPPRWLGWKQFRALGAAALDLCAVADGTLDAFIDCSRNALGVWDYAGAYLVCREAGAVIADSLGRDLIVLDPEARRTPVGAATPALLAEVVAARQTWD